MDNKENALELPQKGMWLVFLRMAKRDGENVSPFDIFERTIQEVPYRNDFQLWAPLKSKNKDGVIGFITEDENDILTIYNQGKRIREALGSEANQVDLYYKPYKATGKGLVDKSKYKFSRKGVFSRKYPGDTAWQGMVWPSEELVDSEDLEDHSGLWLVDLSPETSVQDEKSPRDQALMKLLDATRRGEVKLYSPSANYDLLVCSTEDDRNLEDIYRQGMLIRKIMGDQAGDATMYYKTSEMIRAGITTAAGFKDFCEYRLTNMEEFSRKNRSGVGDLWRKIDTNEFEKSSQASQVSP